MPIVIKKRVSLEFLGDEYQDSYINLRSMSVSEFEGIGEETVKDTVISHFIDGEIQQDDAVLKITKDNIKELSGEVFTQCFNVITGIIDPKSDGELTNQSTTAPLPPEN